MTDLAPTALEAIDEKYPDAAENLSATRAAMGVRVVGPTAQHKLDEQRMQEAYRNAATVDSGSEPRIMMEAPDGSRIVMSEDGVADVDEMMRQQQPPVMPPEETGILEQIQNVTGAPAEFLGDVVQGGLVGIARGLGNIQDIIPIPTITTDDGTQLTSLQDLGQYFSGVLEAQTGVTAVVKEPEGIAPALASGVGQVLPGLIPAVKAMKIAGMGPILAETLGGLIGDFVTSSKTEAEGLSQLIGMIPWEFTQKISTAIDEFITDPDGIGDEDLRGRLVATLPGGFLTPAIGGLIRLVSAAKKSGVAQEVWAKMRQRWDEDKSPVPIGMSIEDVGPPSLSWRAGAGDLPADEAARLTLVPSTSEAQDLGKRQRPGRHVYSINDATGAEIGFLDLENIKDGNARISDIVISDSANRPGPAEMRKLLEQLRKLHPEIEVLSGHRVSGARRGGKHGFEGSGDEVSVRLPLAGDRSPELKITGTGGKNKNKVTPLDIGEYWDQDYISRHGRQGDPFEPQDFQRAVDNAAEEVRFQLQQEESGKGWYDTDISDTWDIAAKAIPALRVGTNQPAIINGEVVTPKDLRVITTAISAPLSFGQRPHINFYNGLKVVNLWLETGRIPDINPATGKGWTQRPIVSQSLRMMQSLIDQHGVRGFVDILNGMHSVDQLRVFKRSTGVFNDTQGMSVPGKGTDEALGFMLLGRKGGPFAKNLNGIADTTADLWFTRTWNRQFGRMRSPNLPADQQIKDQPVAAERGQMFAWNRQIADTVGEAEQDTQAILWYFEQQLFNSMGQSSAKPSKFSDGARRYLGEVGGGELPTGQRSVVQPLYEADGPKGSSAARSTGKPSTPKVKRPRRAKEAGDGG